MYCNFIKVFDKVSHKCLLKVLKYYWIPSKIADWIESFLTNRKQSVTVNGTPSSWHGVISGVPKWLFLGPILFAVYINTLIEVVKYSDLQMIINFLKYFLSLLQYVIDSMYNWDFCYSTQKIVLPCILIANLIVLFFFFFYNNILHKERKTN